MGGAVAALVSEILGFEPEVQLLGDNQLSMYCHSVRASDILAK